MMRTLDWDAAHAKLLELRSASSPAAPVLERAMARQMLAASPATGYVEVGAEFRFQLDLEEAAAIFASSTRSN